MQAAIILQRLEKTLAGDSDQQLLERFLAERDAAAFRIIVARHGPMVYRVGRLLLRDDADAADAFQATFLILLQRANAIRTRTSLAAYLHGVARQVALRMRTTSRRRQEREARASRAEAVPAEDRSWAEVREILDEELTRLPVRLRSPLVLCYLEGLTQDEAAAHLGLAKRTLQRYLESGRALLGIRLTQRGVTLTSPLLVTLASECIAAIPAHLPDDTIALAAAVRDGKSLAAHSQTLNTLTHEVIRHMSSTRLSWKWLAIALVGIGLGTAVVGSGLGGQPPAREFENWTMGLNAKADDPAKPGDAIAWGKPVDGLKAGMGFRRGEEHTSRIGGSATLVVYLRNESQAPITVTHNENVFEEFVPHVRDANGRPVPVNPGPMFLGLVSRMTRTLEPGETIRLNYAWFLVRSVDWKGTVEAPTIRARPGRYTVACENIPLRLKGRDRDDMNWSTGWVGLTVEDEARPSQAAMDEATDEEHAKVQALIKGAEKKPEPKKHAIHFKDASWEEVLKWYGEASGLIGSYHEKPVGKVTIESPRDQKYTIGEVTDFINEALAAKKYILIRGERSFYLFPADEKIDRTLVPRIDPAQLIDRGWTELIEVEMRLPLKEDAKKLAPELLKLTSPFGSVIATPANSLLILDTAGNIRRIASVCRQPSGEPLDPRFVPHRENSWVEPKRFPFKFKEAAWGVVLEWYAEVTGLTPILPQRPEGNFTLETPIPEGTRFTVAEITDILNEALVPARETAPEVQRLLMPFGSVAALEKSNALLLMDFTGQVKDIYRLAQETEARNGELKGIDKKPDIRP